MTVSIVETVRLTEAQAKRLEDDVGFVVARLTDDGRSQVVGNRGDVKHARSLAIGALFQTPQHKIVIFKPIRVFENGG